jgi:hypothetical protein
VSSVSPGRIFAADPGEATELHPAVRVIERKLAAEMDGTLWVPWVRNPDPTGSGGAFGT